MSEINPVLDYIKNRIWPSDSMHYVLGIDVEGMLNRYTVAPLFSK